MCRFRESGCISQPKTWVETSPPLHRSLWWGWGPNRVTLNCTLWRAGLEVAVTSGLRLRCSASVLYTHKDSTPWGGSKAELSLVLTGPGCCASLTMGARLPQPSIFHSLFVVAKRAIGIFVLPHMSETGYPEPHFSVIKRGSFIFNWHKTIYTILLNTYLRMSVQV